MNTGDLKIEFPKGLLRPELFLGVASFITAQSVGVNLTEAGNPSGSHFSGNRYGRMRDAERRSIQSNFDGLPDLDALGVIQLLGSVAMDDLRVVAGVECYPRLGDRIYAAPHRFIALLPELMEKGGQDDAPVLLVLGHTGKSSDSEVSIKPERLFGRHCAILGATGGGKSWTTARIIEQCVAHRSKLILLDATGEYRDFMGPHVKHLHLGDPVDVAADTAACLLPPTGFVETDFIALFEPSGKVQGPKLRAAIRSLRLAAINPELATEGIISKHNESREKVDAAEADPAIAARLDDPRELFDVKMLTRQIQQECVFPSGGSLKYPDFTVWGNPDEASYSFCLSMIVRINAVISSTAYACVFDKHDDS